MAKKSTGDGLYEVVWPSGERKQKMRPLAKRLDTLNGKTVAQLWDYLFAGDEVFAALEEKLAEQYPDVKWVSWREFGTTQEQLAIVASKNHEHSTKNARSSKTAGTGRWGAMRGSSMRWCA